MKALVVHCSRTGHTDALAREIAARCGADVERIRDAGVDRSGLLGYLRSGWRPGAAAPRRAPAALPGPPGRLSGPRRRPTPALPRG